MGTLYLQEDHQGERGRLSSVRRPSCLRLLSTREGREGTKAGAESTWRPAVKGHCCRGGEGESSFESISLESPSGRNGTRKESLWPLTVQLCRC